MIGRTLDAVLEIIGRIGLNKGGSDSLTHIVASELRHNILPVEKQSRSKDEEDRDILVKSAEDFSDYSLREGMIKRLLAKAFEKRRKVKVGEEFTLKDPIKDFMYKPQEYSIERLSRNTIEVEGGYGRYIVSSSKKELLEYGYRGFIPIHYKWVIF